MTTRYKGFKIILDDEMRDDDAEDVITALFMIKRVKSVLPIESIPDDDLAEMRVKLKIRELLANWIKDNLLG